MYKILFVDGTIEFIAKRVYMGFWCANKERIRGIVDMKGGNK